MPAKGVSKQNRSFLSGLSNWAPFLLSRGPRNVLRGSSKFARKSVQISIGGKVYAPSEVMDHVDLR